MMSHSARPDEAACPYSVGTQLALNRPCQGNPAGSTGVVVTVFARQAASHGEGAWGVRVLFPNGALAQFSAGETAQCLEYGGEVADARLAAYRFESEARLAHDFRVGLFDRAFESAMAG